MKAPRLSSIYVVVATAVVAWSATDLGVTITGDLTMHCADLFGGNQTRLELKEGDDSIAKPAEGVLTKPAANPE